LAPAGGKVSICELANDFERHGVIIRFVHSADWMKGGLVGCRRHSTG
jgi:hypothetical protein